MSSRSRVVVGALTASAALALAGAVHDTFACAFPGTADTAVGAAGAPTVTGPDAADCGPVPFAFFAATLNEYVVPFANPVTVALVAVELNVVDCWATDPTNGVTT